MEPMVEWATKAADLLLGAMCPGCTRPGINLCRSCANALRPRPNLVGEQSGVPVIASGTYREPGRSVVNAWKEQQNKAALPVVAHLLAAGLVQAAQLCSTPVTVVPVPTTRRSRRSRGTDVLLDVVGLAQQMLHRIDASFELQNIVKCVRQPRDQAGLTSAHRSKNMRGAFAVKPDSGLRSAIVVDDIYTTGATAAEMIRALNQADIAVAAICVALVTELPSDGQGHSLEMTL